jgi:hypothetical protein
MPTLHPLSSMPVPANGRPRHRAGATSAFLSSQASEPSLPERLMPSTVPLSVDGTCCAAHAAVSRLAQQDVWHHPLAPHGRGHHDAYLRPSEKNEDFDELARCCQAIDLDEGMGSIKALSFFKRLMRTVQVLTGYSALMGIYFGVANYSYAGQVLEKIDDAKLKNRQRLSAYASFMEGPNAADPGSAHGKTLRRSQKHLKARDIKFAWGDSWQKFVRYFEGPLPGVGSALTLASLVFAPLGVAGMAGVLVFGVSHAIRYALVDAPRCARCLSPRLAGKTPYAKHAEAGRRAYNSLQQHRRRLFLGTAASFALYGAGAFLFLAGSLGASGTLLMAAAPPLLVGMVAVTYLNNLALRPAYVNNRNRFIDAENLGNKASMLRQLQAYQVEEAQLRSLQKTMGCRLPWAQRIGFGLLSLAAYLLTFGFFAPWVKQAEHAARLKAYRDVDMAKLNTSLEPLSAKLASIWREEAGAAAASSNQLAHDTAETIANAFSLLANDSPEATEPEEDFLRLWTFLSLLDVLEDSILPVWAQQLAGEALQPWWTVGSTAIRFHRDVFVKALRRGNPQAQLDCSRFVAEATHHLLHVEAGRIGGNRSSLLDHFSAKAALSAA